MKRHKIEYNERNPKIDLFARNGTYLATTQWARTCADALWHYNMRIAQDNSYSKYDRSGVFPNQHVKPLAYRAAKQ